MNQAPTKLKTGEFDKLNPYNNQDMPRNSGDKEKYHEI